MSKKRNFKVGDKVRFTRENKQRIGVVTDFSVMSDNILVFSKGMKGHMGHSAKNGPYPTDEYWFFYKSELEKIEETIVIYSKGQEVIALDKATGKKAVAKCCPEDEFDFNIGSKLAFERLLNIEQPKYKEVRRLAKTGEYVKIVKPTSVPDNEYKVGDILKIVKISWGEAFYGTEKAKDGRSRCLHQSEYVVLEGYEPPKEEKKYTFFNGKAVFKGASWHSGTGYTVGKIYEFKNGFCIDNDGVKRPMEEKGYHELPEEFIEIVE